MLRSVFFLINVVFWTIILGSFSILLGFVDKRGKVISFGIRLYAKILIFFSGIKIKIIGLDNLDKNKNYIFASNHESNFDIPLIFSSIPFHLVSMAKKELKKIPIFGWAMSSGQHIFIDRFNKIKAVKSLKEAKESVHKNPRSLIIFPEGTRSQDGKINQFKKGGLSIAYDLEMDVVPVAVCGTRNVLKRGSILIKPNPVELRIGKPIKIKNWKEKNKRHFANYIQEKVIHIKSEWIDEVQNSFLSKKIKSKIDYYNKMHKKIVFTNGCFDLLHKGHIHALNFASNLGDFLIVGINSDKSIERLKGKNRPIQNQFKRLNALQNLKNVDLVIIFEEDTPEKIIQEIKPNILVKGKDYKQKEVVGKDFIESYGGKLVFSPILANFSTTKIIKKMNLKKDVKQLD